MDKGAKVQTRWVMLSCVVIILVIGLEGYNHFTRYDYTMTIGNGPLVRGPDGKNTINWTSEYRVNRWTGAEEVKYTDILAPKRSHGWHTDGRHHYFLWLPFGH